MEIEVWGPLAVAITTAVAGIAAYAWNKRIDRRHALIELRRGIYRDFILSIADVSESNNGDGEVKAYRRRLAELHLVGSDEVIRACEAFTSLYRGAANVGSSERAKRFAQLEMAMRRDCFEKTQVTVEELRSSLPFTF